MKSLFYRDFSYFEEKEKLRLGACLFFKAWDNKTRLCLLVSKARIIVNKDVRGYLYLLERGEILRPSKDKQMRRHLSSTYLLIKDESWGIEDD